MKTVLVTGLAGFVGSHLADLLLQDPAVRIAGLLHPDHEVRHLEENARITIYRDDILKDRNLKRLIKRIQPEEVFHLAGLAHVHESWRKRKETIRTNFLGSFHLLEACRTLPSFPRVLLVGSADCYGVVPEQDQPITESHPLIPSSPYAVSKIAQEYLGMQYARGENVPVYLSRSFNHTGPRQKETFVCSSFARQVALGEVDPGARTIRVGNLESRRDFSDVRDVVRAYRTILDHGVPGEPYNVCSGNAVTIRYVLDTLIEFSTASFEVITDQRKFRPADLPLLLGSPRKLQEQTGWKPHYDIRATLHDLLDYWRERLKTTSPVAS